MLIAPPIGIAVLLLLPFLSGEGEKSWRRRPIAVLTVLLLAVMLGTFTRLASYTPWSPEMNAWSGLPLPERYLKDRSPLERRGALVFQDKQCRNCHALDGKGGLRGPALDTVATRLTQDQLIRQVLQGRGEAQLGGLSRGLCTNHLTIEPTAGMAARKLVKTVVRPAGLEPATLCLEGRCSIHLSYGRTI